jgi:fatty acid amide hydrolase
MGNTQSTALHERGQRKRAERDARHVRLAKLADTSEIPEGLQERILNAAVTELLQMMVDGVTNSETITKVYVARCHHVGYGLNSVTEEAYDEALGAARESDRRRAAGGPIGLLEGVPVSIKHHLDQRGYDSDCGVAARTFLPSAKDGLIVELIRDAGGIPFVRSQIPQCMMVPESDNFVWGRAINPYSASRTPGGSSGGEGSLVAARCSPLGIGSDIGGSIRIPAHFCGVFGFKPTPARVTRKGSTAPRPGGKDGQHAILPTIGPLGRCTDDLVLVRTCSQTSFFFSFSHSLCMQAMRALWADKMFVEDPTIPHSPFRAPIYYSLEPRRLRVGYFTNMNFFEPAAACVRAVDESVAALRAAGHEVLEWDPISLGIDLRRASILFYALLGADGQLRAFKSGLEGEGMLDNANEFRCSSDSRLSRLQLCIPCTPRWTKSAHCQIGCAALLAWCYEPQENLEWRICLLTRSAWMHWRCGICTLNNCGFRMRLSSSGGKVD